MLCPYHKQQTIPLALLVLMGMGVMVATFLNRGLHPILLTLLPGVAFTVFYCLCIFGRERKTWHRWAWKVSMWWSGLWLVCFALGFFVPIPFAGVAMLPAGWAGECG